EQLGDARQRAEGTGLGLAISQRLLQQMGSALQIESQVGEGSRFWFELVAPLVVEARESKPSSEHPIVGYEGPRRTILVVDDRLDNGAILVELLTPLDFRVLEAADGRAALDVAQVRRPDVILMDLLMPDMNGIEATRALRQLEDMRGVVIIATSASVFDTDRLQSLLAGCDGVLRRPVG